MEISVLIVDDSKLARIVMAKAISALHPEWCRIEAGHADEALHIIAGRKVDIAILDYNMPGRDGLVLAEELRTRFPAMPIAIATANVQEEVVARARAADATFVAKPVTEDGLRGFLSEAALRLRQAAR